MYSLEIVNYVVLAVKSVTFTKDMYQYNTMNVDNND